MNKQEQAQIILKQIFNIYELSDTQKQQMYQNILNLDDKQFQKLSQATVDLSQQIFQGYAQIKEKIKQTSLQVEELQEKKVFFQDEDHFFDNI